jgi:capsular polysaccharide export protein
VTYLGETPLGPLLRPARGVVTVNSTAAGEAMVLGKPVAVLGRAIYDMPGLTWQGRLDAFWSAAEAPDPALVDAFRRVLIARCLIRGGFFSEAGIDLGVANAVARFEGRAVEAVPAAITSPAVVAA